VSISLSGRDERVHAWAYLRPDMARAMAELATVRAKLPAWQPPSVVAAHSLTERANLRDARCTKAVGPSMRRGDCSLDVLR